MNEIVKQQTDIRAEAAIIGAEAMRDAGYGKMLKFRHGDYWIGEEQIPLGTQYLAHCVGWVKQWVHFENRQVVDRKTYRVVLKERAPARDEIPDNDPKTWPPGLNGTPADPWTLQFHLPLEDINTGVIVIFVSGSYGGKLAVADLCTAWNNRVQRGNKGQPLIKLSKTLMPTNNFGDVPRPLFEIVSWDDGMTRQPMREVVEVDQNEMNDQIPFN